MNNNFFVEDSSFREEAERLRKLNEDKNVNVPWYIKIAGYVLGVIISVIVFIPLIAYNIFSQGFVGMQLWKWFVVSSFDVPQLSILQIAGVSLLIRLFTYQLAPKTKTEEEPTKQRIISTLAILAVPWLILVMGYVIHKFI